MHQPIISGVIDKPWSNNNSGCLNLVIKQAIDWKSKPLFDLITI